jgi:selenide,water dikinase
LTKPLGTQVAVNLNQWLIENNTKWTDQASKMFSQEQVKYIYYQAVESMATLNKNAAGLMQKYECHGSTDMTGFGIRGHAQNLVNVQKNQVSFEITSLPVFAGTEKVNKEIYNFKLFEGYSAETSGGLFIIIPAANADAYMKELLEVYGQSCW